MRTSSFIFNSRAGISWLEAPNLIQFPWIVHAFGTRAAGKFRPWNIPEDADFSSAAAFIQPERAFLKDGQPADFEVASLRQVHSADIVRVTRKTGRLAYITCGSPGEQFSSSPKPGADALIANESGLLLTIRTADCLPVLMADTRRSAVAAVHAGWRGALKRIVGKTVREMQRVFNSAPQDLIVALGPSIRSCCYIVGQEVVDAFRKEFTQAEKFFRKQPKRMAMGSVPPSPSGSAAESDPGMNSPFHLDLVEVALDQLATAGVPGSQIAISDLCTACRADLFYSYRREGATAGRMVAIIGMNQTRLPKCRI